MSLLGLWSKHWVQVQSISSIKEAVVVTCDNGAFRTDGMWMNAWKWNIRSLDVWYKGGGANAVGVASDLEGLQTALLGLFLQHSIARALMQIKQQAELFDKNLLLSLSSKKAKVWVH